MKHTSEEMAKHGFRITDWNAAMAYLDAHDTAKDQRIRQLEAALREAEEPMQCGHFGANLQPCDEGPEVCIVCAELAEAAGAGGKVRVLPARDGDVLVFSHPGMISQSAYENIERSIKTIYPNSRVLILEEGADLSVLRNDPEKKEKH